MASPSADDQEAQAALLARLEAQFGDLDVANLLSGSSPGGADGASTSGDADIATCIEGIEDAGVSAPTSRPTTSAAAADGMGRPASKSEESDSDESSVLEPTAEELERWQQAQYESYAAARQAAARETKAADADADGSSDGDARAAKDDGAGAGGASSSRADDQDGPEAEAQAWVRVDEPPSLGGHESAFFGRTSSSAAAGADAGADRLDLGLLGTLHERSNGTLGGRFHPLYRSNVDGRSYVSCVHAIRGYDGPTIMLIGAVPPQSSVTSGARSSRSSSGRDGNNTMAIIGFYTQTPWSEQPTGYGSEHCFLLRVNNDGKDLVQMYPLALGDSKPASASNNGMPGENPQNEVAEFVQQYAWAKKQRAGTHNKIQHQFLHSKSAGARPSGTDRTRMANGSSTVTVPPGLGVGGGPSSAPRLHLTESLDRCTALPYDEVFAPGPLLPESFTDNFGTGIHFDADVVEVWAVGGEDRIATALAKQRRAKSAAESQRQRNARVDKAAFLEDFQSGLMDGGKLFEHRAQARGRHDFEVDEDEEGHERKGGYKLPVERSESMAEPSRTIPGTGL